MIGLVLCCLMTPGLSKDIRCHVWPYFFKLANTQIRHQVTHEVGCQPGICIWSLQWTHDTNSLPCRLTMVLVMIFKMDLNSKICMVVGLIICYNSIWKTSIRLIKLLTLKVLNFWKHTSYCKLKPLWSGMGEVVPARTSPTLHPPSLPTVHKLSRLAL